VRLREAENQLATRHHTGNCTNSCKKINEHNIRVNDIEKMLVINYLEISEYNFRANIIIKVLVKIITG
jgi:hypothetical protein